MSINIIKVLADSNIDLEKNSKLLNKNELAFPKAAVFSLNNISKYFGDIKLSRKRLKNF